MNLIWKKNEKTYHHQTIIIIIYTVYGDDQCKICLQRDVISGISCHVQRTTSTNRLLFAFFSAICRKSAQILWNKLKAAAFDLFWISFFFCFHSIHFFLARLPPKKKHVEIEGKINNDHTPKRQIQSRCFNDHLHLVLYFTESHFRHKYLLIHNCTWLDNSCIFHWFGWFACCRSVI